MAKSPRIFKQELAKHKPGKILLPAEDEGRNAVYAAKLGQEVYVFDSSSEAIKKHNNWQPKIMSKFPTHSHRLKRLNIPMTFST